MRGSVMVGERATARNAKRISRLRLFALLAMLALGAAACGGGAETPEGEASDGAAGGEGGAEEVTSCADNEEEAELLVWGSRDYYVPPALAEGVNELHPNITINTDVQSNDDILQQLQRMKDAGQKMPDIVHDDTFLVEQY